MTLAQLQTLCSVWADDVNYGYFTQAQWLVWLNNAQREAQKKLLQAGANWYMQCWYTLVVSQQSDYILPTDFLKEHKLDIILSGTEPNESSQTLEKISQGEADLMPPGTGVPTAYYLKKNRAVIVQTPDSTTSGKKMRLWYSPLVVDLANSSDVPDVPTQYQEYIALLALKDAFIRDGRDISSLNDKLAYYDQMMEKDMIERTQDAPRHVIQTNAEGFDNLF